MNCHFCLHDFIDSREQDIVISPSTYNCHICGPIRLTEEVAEILKGEIFDWKKRKIISCVLRNEYEKRGKKPPDSRLDLDYLHRIVDQYVPLTPLEKLDFALQRLSKLSEAVGVKILVETNDCPLFHCFDPIELKNVIEFLHAQQLINYDGMDAVILPKGYERLQQIEQSRQDSTTCFVAMWFTPEMQKVFDQAVKPAIEFIEEGKTESRYKAIKLDNIEYINNINDEIIATIRRSRFMVCDLTGYRGGVYFEAGFAYGLGMPVIYTCRKDWCSEEKLKDNEGKVIEALKDSSGKEIRVRKEGVHFDLAHMNRIEWEEDKLDDFRKALENRIKAVIV